MTVANESSVTISNVVASGSGFSEQIPIIHPGEEWPLKVHPSGETSLRIRFEAGMRQVDSGEQGYFEARGGYRVQATVNSNLSISISGKLRRF